MKTFDDLEFQPHKLSDLYDKHAVYIFDNGFWISVITGISARSSEKEPYELSIYQGDNMLVEGDNPIGFCTEEKVTLIMEFIESINILHMLERKLKKGELK